VRGELHAPLPIGGYIHAPGNAWRAFPGVWKKRAPSTGVERVREIPDDSTKLIFPDD